MRMLSLVLTLCVLGWHFVVPNASAAGLIVGVNIVGAQRMDPQQQAALLDELTRYGVKTVRTPISRLLPPEGLVNFIATLSKHGIGTILMIPPDAGGSSAHTRPADASLHLWEQPSLSDANPNGFRKWFAPVLAGIEASGTRLVALEFGNEINNAPFNGDFTRELASKRFLGRADFNNPGDAEGQRVAAGLKAYLRVMATLKEMRDATAINRKTPIISAGLVGGSPGAKQSPGLDGAAGLDTLEFLRQNGLDRIADGYGIHVYPSKNPKKSPADRIAELNAEFFQACGRGAKPCWVTEWGFSDKDKACPLDDGLRAKVSEVMVQAFGSLAASGQVADITYFSWSDPEFGIFRCGALTQAGSAALR